MKGVAIKLDKYSTRIVVASLPFNGKAEFAWAALKINYTGGNWFYVSINPRDPGKMDYSQQIISEVDLERFFNFETPANATFWFPVELDVNEEGLLTAEQFMQELRAAREWSIAKKPDSDQLVMITINDGEVKSWTGPNPLDQPDEYQAFLGEVNLFILERDALLKSREEDGL